MIVLLVIVLLLLLGLVLYFMYDRYLDHCEDFGLPKIDPNRGPPMPKCKPPRTEGNL